MSLEQFHIADAVVIGIGAALFMDLWNLFLQRAFNIASLNFCLVGRWLSHMADGTFTHARIGSAAKRPAECVIGWTAHFLEQYSNNRLIRPRAEYVGPSPDLKWVPLNQR